MSAASFDPVAGAHIFGHYDGMYRKDADRLIVRDVRTRLPLLRQEHPWASWKLALTASSAAHPEWYHHHKPYLFNSVEPLLRDAGVDMSEPDHPFRFIGNSATD
jgi:hypothetical protein